MDIIQNLEDAGCDAGKIADICQLYDEGQIQAAIKVLRRHKCALMEELHVCQGKVDCLDHLLYQLEKALKEKGIQRERSE